VAKIFIGGSIQALPLVREVEAWFAQAGHDVVPWDSPDMYGGDYTLEYLQEAAEHFDAGVFVFSEEDRALDERQSGRDKALSEFGLFAGMHGKRRAVICYEGKRRPNDLVGMTYIDISAEKRDIGRRKIERWAVELGSQPKPKVIRHGGEVAEIIKRFPIESYKIKLQRSQLATILDVYLPSENHLDLIQTDLVQMLENQGSAQILLCDPDSPACALREAALLDSKVNVKAEVQNSLRQLRAIHAQLPAEARQRFEVRLYNSLPAMSSYRVDDMVIAGCNFHESHAIDGPQFRAATLGSLLGERLELEHRRVWDHPQTRKVDFDQVMPGLF
jgi:hypothetical protein